MARYVDVFPQFGVGQQWNYAVDSVTLGTQPSTTVLGTAVTPAENAYGSYTTVLTPAQDIQMLEIGFSANATSGQARDTICNVSTDGGSTIIVPNLLASCACLPLTGGIVYYFPLWVKAGTALSVAASVNNATVGTLRVRMRAWGQSNDARHVRAGRFVRSFGENTATSSGTAVTTGQASEGVLTQLGVASLEELWFWQLGVGVNSAAMNNFIMHADLSINDGVSARTPILNQYWHSTNGEDLNNQPVFVGCEMTAPKGSIMSGRLQSSGAITNTSMIAYGVGG